MIAHKNIIKDLCRLLFWYPLRWFVLAMPFVAVYWLGGIMGGIDYYVSRRTRIRKMLKNISGALNVDERNAKRIVKENLKDHLRNMLEFLKYPQFDQQGIAPYVKYEGIDHLDSALASGKGVILLTAHFGAKQFLQVALGLQGYALYQINFHMGSQELSFIQKHTSQRLRINIEKKLPVTFVSAKGFMRSAFKCLRTNGVLIIAGDGIGLKSHMDASYSGFDFLGKKMLFPTNVINLARRTQSVIVPVFAIREKTKHRIVFKEALNDALKEDAEALMQYIQTLEGYVSKYPFLWEFWEEFDESGVILASDKAVE